MIDKFNNYIGFMDETGVLKDESQRFFALGLLKMNDTAIFYSELLKAKSRLGWECSNSQSQYPKKIEFKFNWIKKDTYRSYLELIDFYFNFKDLCFCCLIIDKEKPTINTDIYNAWDLYISYSVTLIKKYIKPDEKLMIVADYFGKPKNSTKYWEKEILKIPKVYNAIMLESDASLFIQVVDVLIGAIAYRFKLEKQKPTKTHSGKIKVCEHIEHKIGTDTLAKNIRKYSPNYFSVWDFNPYK